MNNFMEKLHGNKLLKYAKKGNVEMIKQQLAKGINIRYSNRKDEDALMMAVKNNHKQAATFLIEKGADVNAYYFPKGSKGRAYSLMYHAISNQNIEMIQLLINSGYEIRLLDFEAAKIMSEEFNNLNAPREVTIHAERIFNKIKNNFHPSEGEKIQMEMNQEMDRIQRSLDRQKEMEDEWLRRQING